MRLLGFTTLLLLAACGDPATSEECKQVRREWNVVKIQRDAIARRGNSTIELDALLAEMVNDNWDCFH